MSKERFQPYLTSDDGELFNLTISYGEASFNLYDLSEREIYQLINDIENMLKLLTAPGGESLKERNERIQSGGWVA